MKRYRVVAHCTISVSTVVFAENEAHARELASDRGDMEIIHGQGDSESEWVTSGELDGEPVIVDVHEDGP